MRRSCGFWAGMVFRRLPTQSPEVFELPMRALRRSLPGQTSSSESRDPGHRDLLLGAALEGLRVVTGTKEQKGHHWATDAIT